MSAGVKRSQQIADYVNKQKEAKANADRIKRERQRQAEHRALSASTSQQRYSQGNSANATPPTELYEPLPNNQLQQQYSSSTFDDYQSTSSLRQPNTYSNSRANVSAANFTNHNNFTTNNNNNNNNSTNQELLQRISDLEAQVRQLQQQQSVFQQFMQQHQAQQTNQQIHQRQPSSSQIQQQHVRKPSSNTSINSANKEYYPNNYVAEDESAYADDFDRFATSKRVSNEHGSAERAKSAQRRSVLERVNKQQREQKQQQQSYSNKSTPPQSSYQSQQRHNSDDYYNDAKDMYPTASSASIAGNDLMSSDDAYADIETFPCPECGRRFARDALNKHVSKALCKKKPRKVFDMSKRRVDEHVENVPVKKSNKSSNSHDDKPLSSKKVSKWRQERARLQEAIRAGREISRAISEGRDLSTLPPPPVSSEVQDDRVECPHCSRKFAELVAERHIPHCKNTINKPKAIGMPVRSAPKQQTLRRR